MTAFKYTNKKINVDQIAVGDVQRVEGLDTSRAEKIGRNFRQHALGTVTLSEHEDGTYVVLDGMHRLAGARIAGYHGLVDSRVFTGLTIAEEAELFLYLNDAKLVSALSRFNARLLMGEPEAVEITAILASHQWTVSQASTPGVVSAIDAVERIYRSGAGTLKAGRYPQLLDRVFEIVTVAWEWDRKSADAQLLLAVAQIIGRYGAAVDTKKLVEEMQTTRPGVLVGRAKTLRDAQGGTVSAAMAKILTGMHNKRRRSNLLPEWVWIR